MKRLSKNWIIEPHLDFEYKKYLLLAYLQHVERSFSAMRLFPYLDDLSMSQMVIQQYLSGKNRAAQSFPGDLQSIDLKNHQLIYENPIDDPEAIRELDNIAKYSAGKLDEAAKEGRRLMNKVRDQLELQPVGLHSSWEEEGYLLVSRSPYVLAFQYIIQRIRGVSDNPPIHFRWLKRFTIRGSRNLEEVKVELVRNENNLMAPKAAYAVRGCEDLPLKESVLPITAKILGEIISKKKRASS